MHCLILKFLQVFFWNFYMNLSRNYSKISAQRNLRKPLMTIIQEFSLSSLSYFRKPVFLLSGNISKIPLKIPAATFEIFRFQIQKFIEIYPSNFSFGIIFWEFLRNIENNIENHLDIPSESVYENFAWGLQSRIYYGDEKLFYKKVLQRFLCTFFWRIFIFESIKMAAEILPAVFAEISPRNLHRLIKKNLLGFIWKFFLNWFRNSRFKKFFPKIFLRSSCNKLIHIFF